MNTAVTECPRCTGQGGAHFAFCFLAQAWERFMGSGFPWAPPAPPKPTTSTLLCVHDVPLSEPCIDCLPMPAEDEEPADPYAWLEWANELADDDLPDDRPPAPTGIPGDPPDPQGVYEDYLVLAGHVESDADWGAPELAERYRAATVGLTSIEVAKTELPDGYLDDLIAAQAPARSYNTQGLDLARQERREAAEDAAVQFVYDCTDTTPGGRVKLNDLHARYVEWHKVNDRPYISKEYLRALLDEMGLESKPGRMPGDPTSGRPPLLVHGVTFRQEVVMPHLPKVVITTQPSKGRERHALLGCKPGRELPQEWQELIEPLITEQGWAYEPHNGNGRGKPRLITPDGKTVTLPSTPHPNSRTLQNTRSFLKQNGALL